MSGVGLVAYQGFLVRAACICVLVVELDLFSLDCNEVSSSDFWVVCVFGMALSSLSFNAQGCVSALLEN